MRMPICFVLNVVNYNMSYSQDNGYTGPTGISLRGFDELPSLLKGSGMVFGVSERLTKKMNVETDSSVILARKADLSHTRYNHLL